MMKMKYYIETNNCPIKLASDVNWYLDRGWELVGGVAATNHQGIVIYAQALVARGGCVDI